MARVTEPCTAVICRSGAIDDKLQVGQGPVAFRDKRVALLNDHTDMSVRSFLPWVLLVVVAAALSIPLALLSEGLAYQHDWWPDTPGMVVARRMVPADSAHGLEVLAKRMKVDLAVDAPVCFVVIVAAGAIIIMRRR